MMNITDLIAFKLDNLKILTNTFYPNINPGGQFKIKQQAIKNMLTILFYYKQ